MERLIQLILQNHPEFAGEIEGVPEEEIVALETLAPTPLPQEYRVVLRYMGRNFGRVRGVRQLRQSQGSGKPSAVDESEIRLEFDALFAAYKRYQKVLLSGLGALLRDSATPEEDPSQYFLFGLDTRGNDNGDFFLDLRSQELRVVEITPTFGVILRAPSLRAFLFEAPFRREVSYYEHNRAWL